MLLELLSKLFRVKSEDESTQKSSESSVFSVFSPVQSQGSSSNPSWKTKAIDQLRRHEGEVLHAYQDHLGYWTIGIGRLIDKRKGGGITRDEAEYLLNNDVDTRLSDLQSRLPWFKNLSDPRKAVLLNMSFQLGIPGLMKFTRTLNLVASGNYSEAASAMLESKWATQTPNRAQEMARQMESGKWQSG
jgi:lysozyme